MPERRTPQRIRAAQRTRWAPTLLALGMFVLTCMLLWSEHSATREEIRADLEVTAEQVAARLSVWISDRVGALEQFATLRGRADIDDAEFRVQTRTYVERVPGFLAINWVDPAGVIRMVVPETRNAPALGRDLDRNPAAGVRAAIDRARKTLQPSRTDYIRFYQDGRGFSIYWPVQAPGARQGSVVNGVITLDAIIANALPRVRFNARYVISLEEADGARIFTTGDVDGPGADFRLTTTVPFVDQPLRLTVQPRSAPSATFIGPSLAWLVAGAALLSAVVGGLFQAFLRRQDLVRRREAYIRLLMDSTTEGVLGVDLDGTCTFCNASGLALLGQDRPEDLVGRPALGWLLDDPPDAREGPARALMAAVRAGERWHAPAASARRRDGELIQVDCTSHPVVEDGTLSGALLTFKDVTAERAEADHAQRLTAMLKQVPDLVGLTDTQGNLTFLNPAGCRLLGLGDRDPRAFNLSAFLEQDTIGRIEEEIVPALETAELWRGEVTIIDWEGAPIPSAAVVMRHRDRLGTVYYSAVVRDLRDALAAEREKRSLEEQFQEAQRLESLGLLAGSIAHDFNNMLVGILGNASLALEELAEDDPARTHVQEVQTATEHGASLAAQLLACSGRGRFEAETIDLGELVRDTSEGLRTSVPRSVTLQVECERARGIVADATQLRQLVVNLVTNAADAIDGEGCVRVRVQETRARSQADADWVWEHPEADQDLVLLEVEDDGRGMDASVLDHVFDPFFTTKNKGRGLGLAAVRGIVRGHGGYLALSSTAGVGTRLRVGFPPSADGIPEQVAPPERSDRALAGTVLLVDDEPSVRQYLETALRTMGFEVIACQDGHEGIASFEAEHHRLVLVLMDQTMPGISGDAAWNRMHEIDPQVPGILISGYDEVRIEGSMRTRGLSGFLQKPFRFQELKETIATTTGPRQAELRRLGTIA